MVMGQNQAINLDNEQLSVINNVVDFWSDPGDQVSVSSSPSDILLPNVDILGGVIPIGATIVKASAMFKCRVVENTNAAQNNVDGDQYIYVNIGHGFYDQVIYLPSGMFNTPATTREGGDVIIGNLDFSGLLNSLDFSHYNLINFSWVGSLSAHDDLNFDDVQMGIRINYNFQF